MTRIRGSLDIACPVEKVFDTVADQRNEPRYNPRMITSIKLTDGPVGVGTRFDATVLSGGKRLPVTVEYTDFERPHLIASRSVMAGFVAAGHVRCEPIAGGTRFSWDWTVTVTGPARLAGPVVGLVGRRQERAIWAGLQRLLEHAPEGDAEGGAARPGPGSAPPAEGSGIVTRHRRWLPEGLFSPVEYAARTPYRRPPALYRRMQSIAPIVGRLGLTPSYVVELEVPGRRTGLPRRSLLVRVGHHGEHYLVALAGESEWVRNVRAAAGQVVLTHHHQRYAAQLTEVPVRQRAEVIRAYVHRPSPRGRDMVRAGEARHYFGIDPDAPLEQIAAIADHYPVFRVDAPQIQTRALTAPQIMRISPTDRAMLAMGRGGRVPEQIGILLLLSSAGSLDLARLRTLLEEWTRCVPQLRRRLVHVPPGCGGPIWVDDAGFDIRRHVREVTVPDGAEDQNLYDTALAAVTTPLPWSAPPWAAVLLTGLGEGRAALVVVTHHVLTDGLGGLALLASMVDSRGQAVEPPVPAPMPGRRALSAQAWSQRWQSLLGIRQRSTEVRRAMNAGGGWHPPRAAPCSLLSKTGPRRRIAVVTADLSAIRAAAHTAGATANDAILVAVGAAVSQVLASRGEAVDPLLVVVPVSGRRGPGTAELGNVVAPLLVPVPTDGPPDDRLARVAQHVRSQKELAAGPPPIATLGWLFRPLAALGAYRWYMNHQHRLHTLVTTVRGPQATLCLDGSPVTSAIPISVGENGNVTVHFSVMSYAGTLTIAIIVDPDHFPDLDRLANALHDQIRRLHELPEPALPTDPACARAGPADPIVRRHGAGG